jgi:glycosyltransferase involved in cell wall biosynthesis
MADLEALRAEDSASSPPKAVDLTILVPVYNEAGNILALAREIEVAFGEGRSAPFRYEILFVDDGSDAATKAELESALKNFARVRVIRHARRAGKSRALITGFSQARGGWIQTLDGDLQNDPRDAANLWTRLNAPSPPGSLGIVAGIRKRRHDGIVKFLSSRIANRVRRGLLSDPTVDTGCGFKLIRSEAARSLPYFDGMHRFLPALVNRAGYDLMQVPVEDRPRGAGVSKYGFFGRFFAGLFDLFGVLWLIRRSSRVSGGALVSERRRGAP